MSIYKPRRKIKDITRENASSPQITSQSSRRARRPRAANRASVGPTRHKCPCARPAPGPNGPKP
eukprot:11163963-Lingulodinium_polyedra.AAC.1